MRNKKAIVVTCTILIAASAILAATRGARQPVSHQAAQSERVAQSATVKLTKEGYQPASLKLERDVPARLTFVRQTDESCGKELVIPEYGIRRSLPLNESVTVEFTPRKAGEFAFTCGMNMLRGKIIVQ